MNESTPANQPNAAMQKDEAIAQATTLTDEALNQIGNSQYDKAIYLAGTALDIVTRQCGEVSFECCKFYHALADAQLCKVENSNDPLSNGGTATAISQDQNKNSNEKFPEAMLKTATEKVKEFFEQAGQKIGSKDESAKPETKETPPKEKEDSKPVAEEKPVPEAPTKKEEPAAKEENNAPAKEDKNESKDNPKIEEEEEEEIITTTRQENMEEEKKDPNAKEDDEDDYTDEFRAPWENLEVALAIFEKTKAMHENPEEFEQINWNTKADILERQADLEAARENLKEAIRLYNSLIDLCIKHNCDRAKSRTIAGILYKIGCAYQFVPDGQQAALDSFYEASTILGGILIEDVKTHNPEEGSKLNIMDLKDNEKLKKIEIYSDKARELQGLTLEINNKIEE